tara:strand:- start:553 stop:822 length:270 start_codon:yes stop_codon:yes gene_type:complete
MSVLSQRGTPITEEHFSFLLKANEPRCGSAKLKLTTEEADRFVQLTNNMVNCMSWNKRVDRELFSKVSRIIELASREADDECSYLPFQL